MNAKMQESEKTDSWKVLGEVFQFLQKSLASLNSTDCSPDDCHLPFLGSRFLEGLGLKVQPVN